MNYYKANSEPLVSIPEENIRADDIIYNELGSCVKKVYVNNTPYFVEVSESVLNEGERISDLTKVQLSLFWTLSRNKLKKNENTD
jgi:hypothetical protein